MVSVLIGLLVIYSSWSLLRETVAVLMEATPGHLDIDEIREAMLAAAGVREVHDLHVLTTQQRTRIPPRSRITNGICMYVAPLK